MSGAIAAVGAEARANQGIAEAVQGAGQLGAEIARDETQKQIYADQLGFEAEVKDAQSRARMAIEAIPVSDGVDYEAESEDILNREYGTLRDYLNSSGNVRNKGAMPAFEQRLQVAEADARRQLAEYGASYERRRSTKRGERMVELGIRDGDAAMIEKGIFAQHEAGKFTRDEADGVYEKSVQKMHGVQDQARLVRAENLLAESDYDGFREQIDSLQLPTNEEKAKIRRDMSAAHAYNAGNLFLADLDSVEEITSFREDPEKFTGIKGLDDNRRNKLLYDARKREDDIRRQQAGNASRLVEGVQRGDVPLGRFYELQGNDTAAGLPQDDMDALEQLVTQAASDYESGRQFKLDKVDPGYVALNDELAETMVKGKEITMANIWQDNRTDEYAAIRERINALQVGSQAKANLWQKYLTIKGQDLRYGWEDTAWLAFVGSREIGQPEQDFRIGIFKEYQRLLQDHGAPEGFGESFERDDEVMRDFFKRNPEPSEAQMKELREALIMPKRESSLRQEMRGGMQGGAAQVPTVTTREEFEALPAGSRFIFNGQEGHK